MAITAADVKKLRDLTDAPMMDCKKALEEASGDIDRAKDILREKGAAAGQKKAGRATKEGIAKVAVSDDSKSAAGIIVECETDFVSRNDDFKAMVDTMVNGMLAAGRAGGDVEVNGQTIDGHISDAVGRIRENIQLRAAEFYKAGEGEKLAAYNHHDGKWASVIVYSGDGDDAAKQVAVQIVAFKPSFLTKDEVPADVINKEMEVQKARAIEEGKTPEMAENIAKGRINKEFYKEQVLLEQPIYLDQKMTVSDYLKQNGGITIKSYSLLAVGMSGEGTEED
ncbi:MAG: translation elongation factor Ts [Fimbriimonadaceae bacterium]|nr:translation elongation factor Ts [Fimbriimonadaceae bacterium]